MKRRNFLKGVAVASSASLLPVSALGGLASITGCSPKDAPKKDMSWDFDQVLDRSGTWSIKMGRAKEGQLAMWIADMDFKTDPYVAEALAQRLDIDIMGYTSVPKEFKEAIAYWLKSYHGWDIPEEWISYAPGVITGLNQAYLAFTNPGDKIIVQPPVYDHFKLYIERTGRVCVDNPLIFENGEYRMDLEGLDKMIDSKTKAIVLCNPQNPGGVSWDKETLIKLADICKKHGIKVFSDEIHQDLNLYDKKHIPFCSVSDAAKEIGLMFTGPTKTFNLAGLTYTAYCIIPDEDTRKQYTGYLSSCKLNEAPIPSLVATIAAYTHSTEWLESLKDYLRGNVEYVVKFFQEHKLGITALRPDASFLVWLDCRELGLFQKDLVSLFSDKAGIVASNGAGYGKEGEGFMRLNIGCPRSVVVEAMSRIEKAINE